jgi:hypothetical protein
MSSPPTVPPAPLWARTYNWYLRHRLELSLVWGIALAIVALLAIIWPTPRTIASVAGCALLVAIDIRLELRKLRRLLPISMVFRDCETAIKITQGAQTSDTEIAAEVNRAMRRALNDLEPDGGDDGCSA